METGRINLDAEMAKKAAEKGYGCTVPASPGTGIGHGIGWAVKQMWHGGQVRRRGWNGRGMHLILDASSARMTQPYVAMKTVDGLLVPWTCSQTDLLATDWELAEY